MRQIIRLIFYDPPRIAATLFSTFLWQFGNCNNYFWATLSSVECCFCVKFRYKVHNLFIVTVIMMGLVSFKVYGRYLLISTMQCLTITALKFTLLVQMPD